MSVNLLPYQVEYLENTNKSFLMGASVGLGKSALSLKHYDKYNHKGRLLIVAPASKVRVQDWPREIEKFLDYTPDFEVISYESMVKRWREFLDPNLTIIADEAHFLCNFSSKRAKAFLKIALSAKQWIGLSGTLLPNGWRSAETYAVLTGLARNKTEFVNRFVVIDRSRGFPLILGYRERETLESWWASIAKPLERTGDMVLPSQSIPLTMTMKPGIARTYQRAVKERMYGEEMLDSPSKLFSTLRQVPAEARIEALHSVLDSTDEHIVVWYNFNSERNAIHALLAKSFKERKVYEQSGHVSELPARDKWNTIKSSVTLVQYQSGAQAIELTYASVNVYLSPCTSYANYEQSKGRTLRNGQGKLVLFYHIAVEGTLDKHIWQILAEKRDFSVDLINKIIDR